MTGGKGRNTTGKDREEWLEFSGKERKDNDWEGEKVKTGGERRREEGREEKLLRRREE